MVTVCVCGCPALDHTACVGNCHGCTCSYFEADLGRDDTQSGPTNARWTPYSGVYGRKYQLDQETA